jgi:hypothetical protein
VFDKAYYATAYYTSTQWLLGADRRVEFTVVIARRLAMSLRSTAKRWTYLVHRWLGIGGCLLMLLWFVSGMVMLFIGYPKLTPGERLAALPVLGDARDLQGLSVLPVVQAEPERGADHAAWRACVCGAQWQQRGRLVGRDRPGAAAGVGTARRSIRCTVRRRPGLRRRDARG